MKRIYLLLFLSAGFFACNNGHGNKEPIARLADTRKVFVTKLTQHKKMDVPVAIPPKELFSIVAYPTNIGNMEAYLGKIPADGKLHPAIIWIAGGFGNDIGEVWQEADPENDQTAGAFREAGIVTMYPAQRGGNMNPGYDESGFGEIDDIIAAADFLAKQPGIDSNRIYLGGHSTGGTKVLLAAESSKRFRAVFSCGAVQSYSNYGPESCTYNTYDNQETIVRAPALWLSSLQTPVYIFEGDGEGNIQELRAMKKKATAEKNEYTHFYEVKNKNHFSALQPVCKIAAQKILADDQSGAANMDFEKEVAAIR